MLYLFQVTVYSALLYSVYLLILKNRASHDWNRMYLLLCASLPLIIPLIKIPALSVHVPVTISTLNVLLPEITVFTNNYTGADSLYHWSNFIIAAYLFGVLAILFRTIIQYIAFKRFVRKNKYEVVNNVKVLLDTNTGPGSFQHYIFLPDNKIDEAIFAHELAHIRLKHSNDILFLRLLQAFFWPNIMLFFISRELKIVHEFQADAYAIKNKETYITTLLNDTFSTNRFSLSHTFFYHPLKRRIMMLQKSPLSRTKRRIAILKTGLLAAILLSGIIYLQSCKQQPDNIKQKVEVQKIPLTDSALEVATMEENLSKKEPSPDLPNQLTPDLSNQLTVFMPHPPYDINTYLSTNLKYPEAARKKKIEGRVIVKFLVDENGSITNPVILRSADPDMDAEALRVVSNMPKWEPGQQNGKKSALYFNLPISFQLN